MKTTQIALTLFLITLCTSLHATDNGSRADALLRASKQAMGGAAWDKVVTWHETGEVSAGGLKGTYESWEDLSTLHNAGSFTLGPDSGGQGWDGKQAWSTDSSKEVRIETSGEAVAQAIQDAYRGGYAFFFPERFRSVRSDAGPRQADGVTYDAIKVTPEGAEPFEVWFDPTTHLIAREVQLTGSQPHTFLLRNFAHVEGLFVPKQIVDRIGNDPKYDTVISANAIALTGPQLAARYAPPPPPPNIAEWPAGADSVSFPFYLRNNHIYVAASINGSAPLEFMFDTGATDILDAGAAKKLGITVEGALPGGGFGSDISAFGLAKVKSVSLGGLTLPDQVFGTMDMSKLSAVEGMDSAGLLGYEFVKRAVLSIDYEKRIMTFVKPQTFKPPAGVAAIPFTFSQHIPMVSGSLDGFVGEFEIDTGSRGPLNLMTPFAAAHDLIARYHATRNATTGYGVGGPSRALLARAGKLTIGEVTMDAPIAEIDTDKAGAATAARTAGNIGGDLLKRYTVTLDYAHQKLWLVPNALASQPEVFDRSGLWIARAKDGAIAIGDVVAQSGAAKAGLADGDEILTVNGKNAQDIPLYELREQFKGAVGTSFTLTVKGAKGERTAVLTLADQV